MGNYQMLAVRSTNAFQHELNEMKKFGNFSYAGIVDQCKDAFIILEKFNVDTVLIEMTSPSAEIYDLIDHINFLPKKPLVAVICSLLDETSYMRAKRMGARLVYRVPYNIEKIFEDIFMILKEEKQNTSIKINISSEKTLDERLANIFISSGIPPHIKGYQFLREAIKQSVHTPSMINNITKQLYPAVAEKFNTSPSKVERAIRHAIEVAWSRGKIENINAIYGIKVFSKGDKPTNGELIALVSDKMIIECS